MFKVVDFRSKTMPTVTEQNKRAPAEHRTNYGGMLWYEDMIGSDGAQKKYPMSRKDSYTNRRGEETIYLQCATKQKKCPAKGSIKNGAITVKGVHNHSIGDGNREVS